MPPGELKASSSKSSSSSNEAKSGGVPPSGSAGGGALSGLGPSSSSSSSEPSPFDPFAAAANEDSRRLQGTYVYKNAYYLVKNLVSLPDPMCMSVNENA